MLYERRRVHADDAADRRRRRLARRLRRIFEAIRLSVEFTIDELVVASDDLAYALTRSNGTQTVLATGTDSAESNREVFIFARQDGAWKISRYLFNKPR